MSALGDSLERMSFMQLLLLFGFVIAYMVSVGGLFGGTVRVRAALLALAQATGFAALTEPWVHGALLVVFVVAGLGLFVLLCWLLARLFGPRSLPRAPDTAAEAATDSVLATGAEPGVDTGADTGADTTIPPSPPAPLQPAPKLVRGARATR